MADNVRKTDDLLIAALTAGQTVTAAAEAAGISARTAHRRLEDTSFQARITEARGQLLVEAAAQFCARLSRAGDTLDKLLDAESEQVRLGAARAIVQQGLQLRQAAEIEARIAALEKLAGADAEELARLRKRYGNAPGTSTGEEE